MAPSVKPVSYFESSRSVTVDRVVLGLEVDGLDLAAARAARGSRCRWASARCVAREISFCAKNASTTTIRIGNAALLKNRLMERSRVPARRSGPAGWHAGSTPSRGALAGRARSAPVPTRPRRAGCGSARRGPGRSRSRSGPGSRSRRSAIGSSTLRRSGLVSSAQTSSEAGPRAPRLRMRYCSVRPGVDDVLDDQDVAALDRRVEVLEDPHDAAGVGRRAVGGDGHEVDLARARRCGA